MKKQKVIILKGLPGSGKSTWAKEQVAASAGRVRRVNKDDLRTMLDGGEFSKQREKLVLAMRNAAIVCALELGCDVIVDDTNLHPKHEADIRSLVAERDADVVVNDSFCKVPLRECIRRDSLRPKPVGMNTINRMAREAGIAKPAPYFIPELPDCIICDIDGTLALMGARNPYDASTCEEDAVNRSVASYVRDMDNRGLRVFLFTGREEKYRLQTERWLSKHGIPYDKLVMRPTGSTEKDWLIKPRMFEEHVRGAYNVHVVLDDRQRVVDAWRDLGLNVWQTNEGNF